MGKEPTWEPLTIKELQKAMERLYYKKDKQRGVERTFMWLVEEIGELATAIREDNRFNIKEEIADVIAWTFSLANLLDIDVQESICEKYPQACRKVVRE